MKDIFYADNRDLVKWSLLLRLAELHDVQRILQIVYYRSSQFDRITIDNHEFDIPQEVIDHFRNVRNITCIRSRARVSVFDTPFQNRREYLELVIKFISSFSRERCIIFLDPDTGLEPQNPSLDHVLGSEAKTIWDEIKEGDILVFYQHQTNRSGQPWIEPKRIQLAKAIQVSTDSLKIAFGPSIARDVVFYFIKKA